MGGRQRPEGGKKRQGDERADEEHVHTKERITHVSTRRPASIELHVRGVLTTASTSARYQPAGPHAKPIPSWWSIVEISAAP